MKKMCLILFALALGLGVFVQNAPAALSVATNQPSSTATTKSAAPGAKFAEAISTITGVAISPLLGTGGYGAIKYLRTAEAQRPNLPWFAQPWFFIPALSIVALCFLKDTAGTALPTALKKPLDVVETVEHKVSGMIAAGAFVPFIAMITNELNSNGSASLGAMGFATADFTWLYSFITVPLAIVAFVIVFLASNAINILILLSPFTTVDAALKGFRTLILASVAGAALINPWLGALWSIIIIGISYFIAGWSFRLTHFGTVFIWDFFTLRSRRFQPDSVENKMYLARKLEKVPARTYGKVSRDAQGRMVMHYRPWLVLPTRKLELPAGEYETGRGLFYSEIVRAESNDAKAVFLLPPRYRGHEEELARIYDFKGTRDVGIRAMWNWFKELCGFKRQPQLAMA